MLLVSDRRTEGQNTANLFLTKEQKIQKDFTIEK